MKHPSTTEIAEEAEAEAGTEAEAGDEIVVGSKVEFKLTVGGKITTHQGKVLSIDDANDAKVKDDAGSRMVYVKDVSELTRIEEEAPADPEPEAGETFEPGQVVAWVKGKKKQTGEVVRLHEDGDRAKVKNHADDQIEWVDLVNLTAK